MLGAAQAVLLGAAGCPLTGYAATVTGIPDLLAYWRFSSATKIVDETAGNRDGTYDGAVSLVSGLPAESDQATRLGGTNRGTVPTDAGLDLAAFTLSFWIVLHEDPEDLRAVLAREQSGLHPGDFGIYYNDGEFYAQFQSASAQLRAFGSISFGTPHHIAVTSGDSGFALWVDGRLQEENASFTGGWSTNGNDLVFGSSQVLTNALDITIDEVALYSRLLTDLEIVSLSQRTGAPVDGGTLVYDWQADADWITGVPLSSRDTDNILGSGETSQPSPNRWVDGASVGGGLVRKIGRRSNWASNVCAWNFAPDGTPALELVTKHGIHNICDFWIQLYNPNDGRGPRHMRVAMDLWLCSPSDSTVHKSQGLGTTSGAYPNFSKSHLPSGIGATGLLNDNVGIKFFCCVAQGDRPRGAAVCNWWNDETRPINGVGYMNQTAKNGKQIDLYTGAFSRPNNGGVIATQGNGTVRIYQSGQDNPGMVGCWFRLETEVELINPNDVPENAIRKAGGVRPTPLNGGGGREKQYVTLDMDGLKGTPGTRTLSHQYSSLINNPKYDETRLSNGGNNMHTLLNLTGPWFDFYYGGSEFCQGEVWAWMRRIQVYVY